MIAKSYYEPAEEHCSLYRSLSYRDEFFFEGEVQSYPETYNAVQFDIPSSLERQLVVHHKHKVSLKIC